MYVLLSCILPLGGKSVHESFVGPLTWGVGVGEPSLATLTTQAVISQSSKRQSHPSGQPRNQAWCVKKLICPMGTLPTPPEWLMDMGSKDNYTCMSRK